MGPSWMLREVGDPASQAEGGMDSWLRTVKEVRRFKMLEGTGDGSARHQATLMHRVRIRCLLYAIIHHIFNDCNRELCLTVSICFRRINHMAVDTICIYPLVYEKLCRAQLPFFSKF
jgi:hypothetical protein